MLFGNSKVEVYFHDNASTRPFGSDNFTSYGGGSAVNCKLTFLVSSVLQANSFEELRENLPLYYKAAGYYAAFGDFWHDLVEPVDKRPVIEVRIERYAARMKPWLTDPNIKCSKG